MEGELEKEEKSPDSRGEPPKDKTSIEEVVNRITEKPTAQYFFMLLGLMSFNLTCPLVAYFPNFGGYVPYTEWRCLSGSKDCLNRTSQFLDQGWQSLSEERATLESRCSIKMKQFDKTLDVHTLELYPENIENDQDSNIGSIIFESGAQKIIVRSYVQCKNDKKSCQKDFPFSFEVDLKEFECHVIFPGSISEQLNETTVDCGAAKLTLSDDEGVLTVVDQIKKIELDGIGSYDLHCPDKDQYNRDILCGTGDSNIYDGQLKVGQDFYWYTQGRTSFSIDWDLYCDREYLRSMISSVYFGGAWVGLIVGGTLYDFIGRKRGALVGYGVVIAACFASAASTSIEFLFVCRFFQGSGVFLGYTGMYVLLLEYAATKYRALVNTAILMLWAVGYLLVTFTGYMIHDWHWLAATSGFLFLTLHLVPLILTPQSPGFLLVTKRDVEGARASLRWLKMLNNSSFDLEGVVLEDAVEVTEEPSFADTMKDFWKYKEMLVQMLIQMWLWVVSAFIYYGFSFSWSSLGKDIYMSYLFAAIGEIIAYTVLTLPLEYWGRKSSHIMMFLVGSASFLFAMIPYKISGSFTVEQLSCLIGSMFVSAVFGFIYLYTIELSPTSHRGRICSYCSITARLGAFSGTYASLMFGWSKKGTLIIFAVLSGLAGLATFRLPDTKGVLTPASAEEVQLRRNR